MGLTTRSAAATTWSNASGLSAVASSAAHAPSRNCGRTSAATLQREPRLPDAADTREGDHACLVERLDNSGDVFFATDEGVHLLRQVAGEGLERSERRKVRRSSGWASWKRASERARSRSRCSPSARSSQPSGSASPTSSSVACDTTICSPWAEFAMRAARLSDGAVVVARSVLGLAGVDTHACTQRVRCSPTAPR